MRVTIWHNIDRDSFMGYEPDHAMLRVFSYPVPDTRDTEAELWRAVEMFNADLDWLTGDDHRVAAVYRARRLRSFSKGDGFSVLPTGGTAEEFRISNGYELLPHEGPFPQLALQSEHGSVALGIRLTYMLPAQDSLIREGLFEIGEDGLVTPEQAVAVHHGVAPQDVVITGRP